MTDILLDQGSDETHLVLDSRVLRTTASDFMLDSPDRRIGPKPFRRALVHDGADSLTVNFAFDYAGGVKLNGVTEVFPLATPSDSQHLQVNTTPTLVVHGGIRFEHRGPKRIISVVHPDDSPPIESFDLHDELVSLQNQISALQAQVAALANR